MSLPKKAIIYYGGFRSRAGGAFMHASLVQEALLCKEWQVQLVTLDLLPRWAIFLPHLALKLGNLFSPPSGFFWKGRTISFLYRLFFPVANSDLVVFEDIYLAWNSTSASVVILHAVWSDNLEGMRFSPTTTKRLVADEAQRLRFLSSPVITVSQEYQDYLVSQHFRDLSIPHLKYVPLGVNLDSIARYRKADCMKNPYSLVYCGVCAERKNLFFLLDVLELLLEQNSSYTLTIIGDGSLLPALQASAAKRSLPVLFKGRLPRESLLEEFSLHSICVHTSTKESFSFALLEAKLLGLSTVASSDLEVPPEFIDVKVQAFDVESWATAVSGALASRAQPDLTSYSSHTMTCRLISCAR